MPQLTDLAPSALVDADDNRAIHDVDEIAASIAELGILQPLVATKAIIDDTGAVVREAPADKFLLVCGHRRKAGAIKAKTKTIPVLVHEAMTDLQRLKSMAVENLEREDITPLEEAELYAQLIAAGMKQSDLKCLGPSQARVSKRIKLRSLPDVAKAALNSGGISVTEAEGLTQVKDQKVIGQILKDGKLDRWALENTLRTQETERRRAASQKELDASGLKPLKENDLWDGRYLECPRDEATHGAVRSGGHLRWYKARPKTKDTPAPAGRPVSKEEAEAARVEQAEADRRRAVWADALQRHTDHLQNVLTSARFDAKPHQSFLTSWTLATVGHGYAEGDARAACQLLELAFSKPANSDNPEGYFELREFAQRSDRSTLKAACALAADVVAVGMHDMPARGSNRSWVSWDGITDAEEAFYEYLVATGYKIGDDEQVELDRIRKMAAEDTAAAPEPIDPTDADAHRAADLDAVERLDLRPGDVVLDDGTVEYSGDNEPWEGYADATDGDILKRLADDYEPPLTLADIQRIVAWERAHPNLTEPSTVPVAADSALRRRLADLVKTA